MHHVVPISEAKTEESSFEENPFPLLVLLAKRRKSIDRLCKQSLTGATELLLDTFRGIPKQLPSQVALLRPINADENRGSSVSTAMLMKMEGSPEVYSHCRNFILSTLTYRERALHRYHYKRKRRMFLRRNKKK